MSLLTFAIAAVVLAITPGPGIAYVVARTVAGGRSEGLASCFGTGIGGLFHVLAAPLGLSLLVAQSADRLLQSSAARAVRARLLTRASGATMLGWGAYMMLAEREA